MDLAVVARLGVGAVEERGAAALAGRSRAALDRPLGHPAELRVAIASGDGLLAGAFQRGGDVPGDLPAFRRGSGGPEVRVAAGSVHVLLSLAAPGALVACDAARLVNRHVRPLLRALTRVGHLAHYFGRDWVSVGGQPVAWVGFAHDAGTGRAAFEALVAVGAPYVVRARESLRGKAAGAVGGVEPARLAEAIVQAYARDVEAATLEPAGDDAPESQLDRGTDPPWAATREEVIGTLGAGRDAAGVFRVGGDLLVSRDALARLEAAAPAVVRAGGELSRLVDETPAAPGVALDGVRTLTSVRDVIAEALGAGAAGEPRGETGRR